MENLTVRELIQKVNAELKVVFEKEVVKTGYNKYDYENGRKVIDVSDTCKIISKVAEGQFSFYSQKFDIDSILKFRISNFDYLAQPNWLLKSSINFDSI